MKKKNYIGLATPTNSKTLFYKDYSSGSVKPVRQLVLAKIRLLKKKNDTRKG